MYLCCTTYTIGGGKDVKFINSCPSSSCQKGCAPSECAREDSVPGPLASIVPWPLAALLHSLHGILPAHVPVPKMSFFLKNIAQNGLLAHFTPL